MSNQQDSNWIFDRNYCGCILEGEFSNDLKKRVAEAIGLFRSFSVNANPSIPYISAWRENSDKSIWYEFAGNRLLPLLGCQPSEVAEIFRDSVLQRLTYHYGSDSGKINKKILILIRFQVETNYPWPSCQASQSFMISTQLR
jgi:hypothetical protein